MIHVGFLEDTRSLRPRGMGWVESVLGLEDRVLKGKNLQCSVS